MSDNYRMQAVEREGILLSPAVGEFRADAGVITASAEGARLGTLRRLGRLYAVMTDAPGARYHLRVGLRDFERVEVGSALAKIDADGVLTEGLAPEAPTKDRARFVSAPCDGILRLVDASGAPFAALHSHVAPGALLAQIESMKLYYEVRLGEGAPGRLSRWLHADGAVVRAGARLAEISDD